MLVKSLELVRIIGSFGMEREKNSDLYEDRVLELFPFAVKNKIPLLYLESVKSLCENCGELKKSYMQLREKNEAILFLTKEIANALSKQDINYVVFKTLRPFPFVASDIDLLFFDDSWKKALKALMELRYRLIGSERCSFTMLDVKSGIKIDSYDEIAVSNLAYMDKRKMEEDVTERTINEVQVPVLTPEADLSVTIAHSFYKEQMYTLADFYAITACLTHFTSKQRKRLIALAKSQHIGYACSLLLRLTQTIYETVFQTKMREIAEISSKLHSSSLLHAASRQTVERFVKDTKLPYKYNFPVMAMGFAHKILRDKSTKRSIPYQARDILSNPLFLKGFMTQLVVHITRETY
jgi:hypothetical protein